MLTLHRCIGSTRPVVAGLSGSRRLAARSRPAPLVVVAAKGADKGGKNDKTAKGGKGGDKGGKGGATVSSNSATAALVKDAKAKMTKTLEVAQQNMNTIRTGRANVNMLDRIVVDYFGAATPLKSLCTVMTPDASTLVLQPFEKSSIGDIEKAILKSDVGMTPNNDGNVIRLRVPELTEERRKEMGKQVAKIGEEGKVAMRNIRRDAMKNIEKSAKTEGLSEDETEGMGDDLDKMIATMGKEIDAMVSTKQKELMKI